MSADVDGVPSDEGAPVVLIPARQGAPGRNSRTSFPDPVPVANRTRMLRARQSIWDYKSMTTGTVKFFNTSKGFGFIAPEGGGKDVFVHVSAVEAAGLRSLNEGQRVTFDIQPDARGAKAANLKAV